MLEVEEELVIVLGGAVVEALVELGVLEEGDVQPRRDAERVREQVHGDGGALELAFADEANGFPVFLEEPVGIGAGKVGVQTRKDTMQLLDFGIRGGVL